MPKLILGDSSLVLSLNDAPGIANSLSSKILLVSVLNLNKKGTEYYLSDTTDFVKTAKLIEQIIEYLSKVGLKCELNEKAQRLLSALQTANREMLESRLVGRKILEGEALIRNYPGLVRQLKHYQIIPANHAIDCKNIANFSVPGSGKTTIAYAAFAALKEQGIVDKIMVIGPRSSFMPWEEEFESCFGRKPKSFRIIGSQLGLEYRLDEADLILLTYQTASNITGYLINVLSAHKCLLVLDESHHIKKFGGGTWSDSVLKIAPYAQRRLILSGTPMPNGLKDLYTQFTFLWPFKNLLGEPLSYTSRLAAPNSLEQIRDSVRPFYSRITKNTLKLPPAQFQEVTVPLSRVQSAIYSALAVRISADLNDSPSDRIKLRQWRRAKIIRLLQAASNPSLLSEKSQEFRIPPLAADGLPVVRLIERYSEYETPSKIIKAEALTRELVKKGRHVIVWNTFILNILALEKRLRDLNPIVIYGDIPKDQNENEFINRERLLKEFKEDTAPRVLLANPSSLAESVSLHRVCKDAIYVDRTFNAGQYIQSLDRIHRIGLTDGDTVTYYIMTARNTIDNVIHARLNQKYDRMLRLLNDDLSIVNLYSRIKNVSDEELEIDFRAVQNHLAALNSGERIDQQS